jgi:hypothetical protein
MHALLYRFLKISSETPKVGIRGCRKKPSRNGSFFDNPYSRFSDGIQERFLQVKIRVQRTRLSILNKFRVIDQRRIAMLKILRTYFCANPKQLAANSNIIEPGYLERTSVLDFVGAASSRDRFNSRLPATSSAESEAAPTGVFFSNLGLPDKCIIELKREIGH